MPILHVYDFTCNGSVASTSALLSGDTGIERSLFMLEGDDGRYPVLMGHRRVEEVSLRVLRLIALS